MNFILTRRSLIRSIQKSQKTNGIFGNACFHNYAMKENETMLDNKFLNDKNVNPCVKSVEYAVRGPIVLLASKLQDELNKGITHPFKNIIRANIGDGHATGQKPITYFRQVLACCSHPPLMKVPDLMPSDVIEKAGEILKNCHDSIGCYSESEGTRVIRKQVAEYVECRDGYPCDYNDIVLTNGASSAIKIILYLLQSNKQGKEQSGVMVPIPQYPLYSASISEFGGHLMPYYLDEDNNWSLQLEELENSFTKGSEVCTPRGLVVINPGNPTGQLLSYENMVDIIKFCKRRNILLMADEVYQENIYADDRKFYSFKKVLKDLGDEYKDFELVSFHSASKGYYGECGIRGGYMEIINMDPDVRSYIRTLMSATLGSTMPGQVLMSCIVNNPQVGDESYKSFTKEKNDLMKEFKRKADMTYRELNSIEGVSCNKINGALYAFPRLDLTESAIKAAEDQGLAPDAYYCINFLKEKGICVVPGSGFKQKPGTHHFRMTILPSTREIRDILSSLKEFNHEFRKMHP